MARQVTSNACYARRYGMPSEPEFNMHGLTHDEFWGTCADCGLHTPDGRPCECECHADGTNVDYVHTTTTKETETMETTGTTERIVLHPYPHMGCYADDNGTCYTQNDGSLTWPDWEGIETCSCGAALPEVCDNDCTECGTPLWHLVSPECANCGKHIHFDNTWWVCLDDGSDYCMECVTVTRSVSVKWNETANNYADPDGTAYLRLPAGTGLTADYCTECGKRIPYTWYFLRLPDGMPYCMECVTVTE